MPFFIVRDVHGDYTIVPKRKGCNEILVHDCEDHFTVDQSDEWLFQWEREDSTCYARRMQKQMCIHKRTLIVP